MVNPFAAPGRSPDHSGEHFELIGSKPLGQGGFAATWRARVLDPGRIEDYGTSEVALKIPLDKDKERVLEKELQLNAVLHSRLRGIRSPNIVRYLGVTTFQSRLVMVMEFVHGGSLRDVLKRSGRRLPVDDAVRITQGVLKGLALIHAEHVFHRDLKPDNVLMDEDTPKLSDLGLSRLLDSNELAHTTSGTLYYMSPELLGSEGASFNADIWSVGVTLYELLTGKLPFFASSIRPTIDLICNGSFVPASEIRKDVPPGLNQVIECALQKNPADRYQTAEEMLKALERPPRSPQDSVVGALAEVRKGFGSMESPAALEQALRDLLDKYPGDPRVFHCLGDFYGRCERHNEALAAFEQGLACDAEEALSHYYVGLAYQRGKQTHKAITSLKRALELGLETRFKTAASVALRALESNR